jgi:AcrR family transcriptional regulator
MMPVIVKPSRHPDPRRRMLASAALLMRERGVDATSFSDVLEHSGAPRGSIYHHFPGGKTQLVEEATRAAGRFVAAGLEAALAESDPVTALERFVDSWSAILRDTEFNAGCTILAVAVAGDQPPQARDAAAEVFTSWESILADAYERHQVPAGRARSLATLAVASLEGAVVLARAQRSLDPLKRVAGELLALTREALRSA